eukprot:TRINITY_DN3795_c0_g1_i1.p1 TRINITY_DN3795_c0_g1~~TRINITY_DN3795_c0_g1_i1.p1  ORF type:complete len:377 (-),score=72.84 TRINITY_DN3795_c0_g1_i1:148-1278(-)
MAYNYGVGVPLHGSLERYEPAFSLGHGLPQGKCFPSNSTPFPRVGFPVNNYFPPNSASHSNKYVQPSYIQSELGHGGLLPSNGRPPSHVKYQSESLTLNGNGITQRRKLLPRGFSGAHAPASKVNCKVPKERSFSCYLCGIECNAVDMLKKHFAGKKHKKVKAALQKTEVASQKSSGKPAELFRCDLCGITCNSDVILQKHFAGRKHMAKLLESDPNPQKSKMSATDDTNVILNKHFSGDKQKKNEQTSQETQVVPEKSSGKPAELFRCDLCGIACNSDVILQKHFSGRKHKAKLQETDPNLRKRKGSAVGDINVKRQRVLDSGTPLSELKECTICKTVFNSQIVFNGHLSGKKHAANLKKLEEEKSKVYSAMKNE